MHKYLESLKFKNYLNKNPLKVKIAKDKLPVDKKLDKVHNKLYQNNITNQIKVNLNFPKNNMQM